MRIRITKMIVVSLPRRGQAGIEVLDQANAASRERPGVADAAEDRRGEGEQA
jgi:hypothetical protein